MTRRRPSRPAPAALIAIAVLVAASACTSSAGAPRKTPPPSLTESLTPSLSASPSTTVPSTAASSTPPARTPSVAPASTTTAPTPPAGSTPPTSNAPAFVTTCATLTVRVIPGGAERGAEIAALQYVNDGSTTCTISGFPVAVLLRGGSPIGTASQPNGRPGGTMTLHPGDTAESLLTDFSTCQAPLSDSVRVTTPARNGTPGRPVVGPARLRACTLRVAPVGPPA